MRSIKEQKRRKEDVTMKENYKRFDVVLVDFGQVEFAGEQGGKRPALILQNDTGNHFSSTTLVAPLTSKIKHLNQPTHLLFKRDEEKGLKVDSMVLGECLRQISEQRIIKKLGYISSMEEKGIRCKFWSIRGGIKNGICSDES